MRVEVEALRAEFDGVWVIHSLTCHVCRGPQLALHPVITPKVECDFCHAFINVQRSGKFVRTIHLSDGDFDIEIPDDGTSEPRVRYDDEGEGDE